MQNVFLMSLVAEAGASLSPLGLIAQAGWVVKCVMLLLLMASIIGWTIIFWKWLNLRNAADENMKFAESFWTAGSLDGASRASKSFPNAPLTRVFSAALHEYNQVSSLKLPRDQTIELLETNVMRTLHKASSIEVEGLQRYLAFLATTASTAPFVGLFGTVWGIMTSFIGISQTGASNLAVVAPGIAEALIATAMGLFAAIPAVLFYNYYISQIKEIATGMNHFASDFLNTAKRSL